jgi:hypothetical protein
MALLKINTNPSDRELRQFAAIWLPAACGVLAAIAWFKFGWKLPAIGLLTAAAVLGVAGFIRPAVVRPVFVGWMYAAFPIGWTISHLILASVYYLVMTPLGFILRTFIKDPMERKFDRQAPTYWHDHAQRQNVGDYFRQF